MTFFQKVLHATHFKTIIIFFFALISGLVWLYLHIYNQHHASTDDAYVNANVVQIAPRITGKVAKLYVVNNQYVKKETIFLILIRNLLYSHLIRPMLS